MLPFASFLALISLLSVPNAQAEKYIDLLFDELIEKVKPLIIEHNLNVINIGKVEHEFSYGISFLKLYGTVTCEGGTVRALTTIYRTGEADAEIFKDQVTVEAPLGLRSLVFDFPKCSLYVKDIINLESPVSGTIGKNSIDLKMAVIPLMEDGLRANLTKIELRVLDDISISTGRSFFARLTDDVVNMLVAKFHRRIFTELATSLKNFENFVVDLPVGPSKRSDTSNQSAPDPDLN